MNVWTQLSNCSSHHHHLFRGMITACEFLFLCIVVLCGARLTLTRVSFLQRPMSSSRGTTDSPTLPWQNGQASNQGKRDASVLNAAERAVIRIAGMIQ